MKKLTFCTLCMLIGMQSVIAQVPSISWEKVMMSNKSHYFADVQELSDGNFILLGSVEQPEENNYDIWLLKIASNGDTIQTATFRYAGRDMPMRILLNEDKGYIIAFINQKDDQVYKSILMAVGTDFSIQWTKEAKKPSLIARTDIAADNNGNIWWLNTLPGADQQSELSLYKLNGEGDEISVFEFSGDYPSEGYGIRALPDGTMGVTCKVLSDKEKSFAQVMRIDQEGQKLWTATVSDANKVLTPQCLCCSPDNTLLLGGWAGLCYNPDATAEEQIWDYDYLLSKIDDNGKVLWTQNYNREGSEMGTAVAVMGDGKILAAGKCETSFTGSVGPWLLLTDSDGKKIDDTVYKFKFVKDQIARIICTHDGGLLMVGPGYIESQLKPTGWIRKLNPEL